MGRRKITDKERLLSPLKTAASQVADMLVGISCDREHFVDQKSRVDTKALKEFASVLKELSSVICELNGIELERQEQSEGVRVEFDSDGEKYSI